MASSGSKLSQWGLNLALVLVALTALVLLWSLFARSGGDPSPVSGPPKRVAGGDIIQVEVRNGAGVTGLAADMTRFLRGEGFDVVEAGDHDNFEEASTHVLNRSGNRDAALSVARSLGLDASVVREAIDPDLYLDASVIIGADYEGLEPFRAEE